MNTYFYHAELHCKEECSKIVASTCGLLTTSREGEAVYNAVWNRLELSKPKGVPGIWVIKSLNKI